MHAFALEALAEHLPVGARALDVGSGTGILAVAMALLVGEGGRVIGIDVVPELVKRSLDNVAKSHKDLLETNRLELRHGDGWR